MPHIFLVNCTGPDCTGPDGKQYQTGAVVPGSWDGNYVASLVKSGGAKKATKADLKEAGEQ